MTHSRSSLPRRRRSLQTSRRPICRLRARETCSTCSKRPACPSASSTLGTSAARGARAAAFNEARTAAHALALEELASRDRELLQELLTGFATAYAAAKDRESALDFEDLQLRAWQLLRENDAIRETEQLRFRSIMVDEFQDTNRLQTELVDLVCAGPAKEMFFVGDEFQSIYGFRHADVAVFRDRRDAAPQVLPLTLNYRSRPEVLAAVNELFAGEFGDEFQAARAGRRLRQPHLRNARRAARHRQGLVCGLRAALASR